MTRKPRNKNLGKSPFDPDYDDHYNPNEEFILYEQACEEREHQKREEK